GQQQAVEMVELVEPLQHRALDHDADGADDDRREHERREIAQVEILQQQERRERAHHVLGAMGEIDDVQHSEDDGEAEAEQRIERAVDQPEQQLPEQRSRRNAEDFEHAQSLLFALVGWVSAEEAWPTAFGAASPPVGYATSWLTHPTGLVGLSRSPAGSRRP